MTSLNAPVFHFFHIFFFFGGGGEGGAKKSGFKSCNYGHKSMRDSRVFLVREMYLKIPFFFFLFLKLFLNAKFSTKFGPHRLRKI